MQRPLTFQRVSDGELTKAGGFLLDWDEIARSGKMSKEEGFVAKWYGIYDQRQAGNFMARIVLPGGVFSTAEARAIAAVSKRYALGRVSFTTRQACQLHWLKLKMLPEMLRELQEAGLSTFHGCGDVTRNVTACPLADVCPHRRFDVHGDVRNTSDSLTNARDLDDLPRKFKISFNGCSGNCALPYMNDIGITAVKRRDGSGDEALGYQVVIGGGHGWQPFVAEPLYGFVPKSKIVPLCRAVALLFREHGDRWNRSTARLKYVVYRLGINRCREIVEQFLDDEGVDRSGFILDPVADMGSPVPERPLVSDGVTDDKGLAIQRIRIPKGELSFRELIRLAELSEMYGDKSLRANHRQNLEIHGVRPDCVAPLKKAVDEMGFGIKDFFGLSDVVTCVGTTYCPLAVTRTHDMFDLLTFIHDKKYDGVRDRARINITGCPNSCSPYRIADIGLRGARIREMQGSVEGYEISVGGSQYKHGMPIGTYKQEDCVPIIRVILDTFIELGLKEESLAETVCRVGIHPFKGAVDQLSIHYETAPQPKEFSMPEGTGCMTPLDQDTVDKDVPCQAACPAGTRVPWYIQKIAEGDPDGAYRINQEDNVFPGVLGRVCTRPCEPACRHQWTGTRGAVAICHLKRAAGDRKAMPPKPLPPWFGKSGKQVAVIGSGPSGLTAARDLKRCGHDVVLFEREKVLGGMMRLSIPHFRLPRHTLDEEIKAITDSGIDVRIGEDITWDRLDTIVEEFDSVLLAAGTIEPRTLTLPGLPEGAAVGGLDLMRKYCLKEPLEAKGPVLIIGGGFTAIDCARVYRRVLGPGGGDITLVVRRTRDLMSATPDEIRHLEEEQISIDTLVSPVSARVEDGALVGVTLRRNILGPPGKDGRPSVTPMEGSEFEVPCRTLLFAIGQTQHIDLEAGGINMVSDTVTDKEKLFVAGDFSTGSLDVIHAVASGKRAADTMDEYLMGYTRRRPDLTVETVVSGETGRLRDHDLVTQPEGKILPPKARLMDEEVEQGFSIEAAKKSADRCYLCQNKYEIDQDLCIHCDWCIKVSPRECIRKLTRVFQDDNGITTSWVETDLPKEATFIWIDSKNCIRCGNCYRICPTNAISVKQFDVANVATVQLEGVSKNS